MNWFLIALVAPALWSISIHIDKYLITKYFRHHGTGSLLIFSSLIGAVAFPIIFAFHPNVFDINPLHTLLIIVNGFVYMLALLPYFFALEQDEASIVVPMFQMIPVFSYVLALFVLGEVLTTRQILSGLLVLLGAVALSLDLSESDSRFKKKVFVLMLLSSFLLALNGLIFKLVAIDADFWTASFWEYVGFALFALFLLVFVKSYRKQFMKVVQANKLPVLGLNGLNEVVNLTAKLSLNFATLLAPLALVWVVNAFEPFFVFTFGVLLTLLFPHIGAESLAKHHLAQKIIAISIMLLGTYLLNLG